MRTSQKPDIVTDITCFESRSILLKDGDNQAG
jgi:hypothetical protein